MKIGDAVKVTRGGEIIESAITYQDTEKSCGYVKFSPTEHAKGHILNFHDGWIFKYWVVALDSGEIVRVAA